MARKLEHNKPLTPRQKKMATVLKITEEKYRRYYRKAAIMVNTLKRRKYGKINPNIKPMVLTLEQKKTAVALHISKRKYIYYLQQYAKEARK